MSPHLQPLAEVLRYQFRSEKTSSVKQFTIRDEYDRLMFNVRENSSPQNVIIQDLSRNGLIQIRQRTMHLHKTYKLLSAGENYYNQEIALITKKFGRNEFRITSIYGDYQMEEFDTKSESFAVRKQDQVVAHITRVSLDSTSNYQVDIVLDEDQIFILALVIVIDQIIDDQRANEEAVEVTKFMNDLSRVSSLR